MDYGSTVTTELDGETPVGKPLALKSAAERARCLLRAGQPRAATRASTASWRRDRGHHRAGQGVDDLRSVQQDLPEATVPGIQHLICLLYTSDAADDLTRVVLGGRR